MRPVTTARLAASTSEKLWARIYFRVLGHWPQCVVDERLDDPLPEQIALCPDCAPEFYYPLGDGEKPTCPVCSLEMVVYVRLLYPTKPSPEAMEIARKRFAEMDPTNEVG